MSEKVVIEARSLSRALFTQNAKALDLTPHTSRDHNSSSLHQFLEVS